VTLASVAVLGAAGSLGATIVAEAASRGHRVTAVSRHEGSAHDDQVTALTGDARDSSLVASVAAAHDVVVSALGPSRSGGDPQEFLDAVATLVSHAGPARLIVVGGAGSLLNEDGVALVDAPGFPQEYRTPALLQAAALDLLLDSAETLDWAYLSPAPLVLPGTRTGQYKRGLDHPVGASITEADYAVALVDEIEQPVVHRARFTVAN
jgi:uncharacterized protein